MLDFSDFVAGRGNTCSSIGGVSVEEMDLYDKLQDNHKDMINKLSNDFAKGEISFDFFRGAMFAYADTCFVMHDPSCFFICYEVVRAAAKEEV